MDSIQQIGRYTAGAARVRSTARVLWLSIRIGRGWRHWLLSLPASSGMNTLACLLFLLAPLSRGAHNPLLPRPQHVQYGSGELSLQGISITYGMPPVAEDRFAAAELAGALREFTGAIVPVTGRRTAGPSLVLYRRGTGGQVPGADDHAGADSREAYELRITTAGAEIKARSSAGLYYASPPESRGHARNCL